MIQCPTQLTKREETPDVKGKVSNKETWEASAMWTLSRSCTEAQEVYFERIRIGQ